MRRTGNTPSSPTIGIDIAGTEKICFAPLCASASPLCVAAPASASAPEARMVLRSTVLMGSLRFFVIFSDQAYLARGSTTGKAIPPLTREPPETFRTARAGRGRKSVLDLRWKFAAVGGKFCHHLLVQPDVHVCRITAVTGVAEFFRQLLSRSEAGIDIECFHQIDDRGAPLQLFALRRGRPVHDRCKVPRVRRFLRGRRASRSRAPRRRPARPGACR